MKEEKKSEEVNHGLIYWLCLFSLLASDFVNEMTQLNNSSVSNKSLEKMVNDKLTRLCGVYTNLFFRSLTNPLGTISWHPLIKQKLDEHLKDLKSESAPRKCFDQSLFLLYANALHPERIFSVLKACHIAIALSATL
jgi:hypothetical protein